MNQISNSSQPDTKKGSVIKAFVMTGKEVAGNIAYKTEIVDGVQTYEGLPIDIFQKIMELRPSGAQ
mgnify:FL=1